MNANALKILDAVREIGESFTHPDDDWYPVLFMSTGTGLKISPLTFATDRDKDAFAQGLPDVFREHRPKWAMLVISCWDRMIEPDEPLADLSREMLATFGVASDPKRTEIVIVQYHDGTVGSEFMATITRHKDKPPTLGEWKKSDAIIVGGRMGHALATAFAAMRETAKK